MNKSKNQKWCGCPIRYGLGQFGDKWSLLIIRDLMFKGRRYYGEFLKAGEGISTNILADRLNKLEANQIIEAKQDPDNQTKKIYSLTEKGIDLIPVMFEMIKWAIKHDEDTEVPTDFARNIENNMEDMKAEILEKINSLKP